MKFKNERLAKAKKKIINICKVLALISVLSIILLIAGFIVKSTILVSIFSVSTIISLSLLTFYNGKFINLKKCRNEPLQFWLDNFLKVLYTVSDLDINSLGKKETLDFLNTLPIDKERVVIAIAKGTKYSSNDVIDYNGIYNLFTLSDIFTDLLLDHIDENKTPVTRKDIENTVKDIIIEISKLNDLAYPKELL